MYSKVFGAMLELHDVRKLDILMNMRLSDDPVLILISASLKILKMSLNNDLWMSINPNQSLSEHLNIIEKYILSVTDESIQNACFECNKPYQLAYEV